LVLEFKNPKIPLSMGALAVHGTAFSVSVSVRHRFVDVRGSKIHTFTNRQTGKEERLRLRSRARLRPRFSGLMRLRMKNEE
jgi:hypothetical protein